MPSNSTTNPVLKLAWSLSFLKNPSKEQIEKLLIFAPNIQSTQPATYKLNKRAYLYVVSLGIFAVESKSQLRDEIIEYLIQLLKLLPAASWVKDEYAEDPSLLPLPERFAFCLSTILSDIVCQDSKYKHEVVSTFLSCLDVFRTAMRSTTLSKENLCNVVVPTMIGLCRGFGRGSQSASPIFTSVLFPKSTVFLHLQRSNDSQNNCKDTLSACRNIVSMSMEKICCKHNHHKEYKLNSNLLREVGSTFPSSVEDNDIQYADDCDADNGTWFDKQQSIELIEKLADIVDPDTLHQLDQSLDVCRNFKDSTNTHHTFTTKHKYESFSQVISLSVMSLVRDCIFVNDGSELRNNIVTFSEKMFEDGYKNISTFLSEQEKLPTSKITALLLQCQSCAAAVDAIFKSCSNDYATSQKLFERITEQLQSSQSTRVFLAYVPLINKCLQALGMLANKNLTMTAQILETIQHFLLKPAPVLIKLHCLQDAVSKGAASINGLEGTIPRRKRLNSILPSPHETEAEEAMFSWLTGDDRSAYTIIKESAIESVCSTLTMSAVSLPAFLSQITSGLFINTKREDTASRLGRLHCAELMSHIAIAMQNTMPDIPAQVIMSLQQRLESDTIELNNFIIDQLACIHICLDGKTNHDILDNLLQLIAKQSMFSLQPNQHQENKLRYSATVVTNALINIALHCQAESQEKTESGIEDLLARILQLFVKIGLDIVQAMEKAKMGVSSNLLQRGDGPAHLGILIPVIAVLVQRLPDLYSMKTKLFKLFRDFWFYCAVLRFTDSHEGCHSTHSFYEKYPTSTWPEEWHVGISIIATKSPYLMFPDGEPLRELRYNSALKNHTMDQSTISRLKAEVFNFLGNEAEIVAFINQLEAPHFIYLYTVYKLEFLRVNHSKDYSIEGLLQYLEDRSIQKDKSDMWTCLNALAKAVFKHYLQLIADKEMESSTERVLVKHVQFLLVKFNSVQNRIRKVADKYLSLLVESFPHILWNADVIFTMLDILHLLSQMLQTEMFIETPPIKVPNTNLTIQLHDSLKLREKIIGDFRNHCGRILHEAVKWAPDATAIHLQNYMVHVESTPSHAGLQLASEVITREEFEPIKSDKPMTSVKSKLSFTPLMGKRTKYLGMVSGMLGMSKSSHDIANFIVKSYNENIGNYEVTKDLLYKATAFFVLEKNSKTQHYLLMLVLCHKAPLDCFTGPMLESCVDCWKWILSSRPDLEMKVMSEIISAWQRSIDYKMGLYSMDSDEGDPLAVSHDHMPAPKPPNVKPHLIWIKFLQQRFDIVKYSSVQQFRMFVSLLHRSLNLFTPGTENIMSRHIAAFGARCTLLILGFSALQNTETLLSPMERNILRERVYCNLFDYFCFVRKFPVQSTSELKSDIDHSLKLWQCVYADRKYAGHYHTDSKNWSKSEVLSNKSATLSRNMTATQMANASVATLSGDTMLQDTYSLASLSYTPSFSAGSFTGGTPHYGTLSRKSNAAMSTTNKSKKSSKKHIQSDNLRKRSLLMYLLTSELEHLISWYNPTTSSDRLIQYESTVAAWRSQEITEKRLRDTARFAWLISPILAVYLPDRLSNSEAIVKEITRLVRNHPQAVKSCAVAIKYLVTEKTLESDSSELTHVLTWEKGSPSTALSYFSRLFSPHPLTAQYAVKALRRFPPEAILFYIPQLVQAVRYDKMGYVEEYIVYAAGRSQLLAHQFIWNMKTNVYVDEDATTKDPEIGARLEKIISRIVTNLSGTARDFYAREFEFFENVTNVSGVIKPYPKGPERSKACIDALHDIEVLPGCYLPSNPSSIVVDIDRNSGIPLQSAAKAPYLAKFQVMECGIAELERIGNQPAVDSMQLASSSSLVWQAAIFKVGDDCRQDMLALQIIQLFQNIFKQVGLDLYLFPYRVVATSPGCGVIECINNSKSRDQLGRQTDIELYTYFRNTYGDENSATFQAARRNFIKSMAAYSLILFILQIKDRHNGNIMLDKEGHLIHIDFGFMFESSPGGNLGWEPDIKLTEEMVMIMGGTMDSPPFQWFIELCVKGYLAVCPYREDIVALVALMLDTGLPCFRGNTIKLLRSRFSPTLSSREAAQFMQKKIRDCFLSKWSKTYDMIQYYQNKIPYY